MTEEKVASLSGYIRVGDDVAFKKLAKAHPDDLNVAHLHEACGWAVVPIVKYLVKKVHMDVNRTHHGKTPLMVACDFTGAYFVTDVNGDIKHKNTNMLVKRYEIIRFLLKKGAKIDTVDANGRNATSYAKVFDTYMFSRGGQENHKQILELLGNTADGVPVPKQREWYDPRGWVDGLVAMMDGE